MCLSHFLDAAQNMLANLITLLLGMTIVFSMRADVFVNVGDSHDHGDRTSGICF